METTTKWQPGKSGNPKGRPKKARALTALMERHGGKKVLDGQGRMVTQKEVFVEHVWYGLRTGRFMFHETEDDIRMVPMNAGEWLTLARMVLGQIDGAPPAVVAMTGEDGGPVPIRVVEVVKTYSQT